MRSRMLFAFVLAVSSFALPLAAHAGGIPFFGPIVPDAVNKCAAGWGAVIDVINNIIRFLLTLVIVFVAPLMIAYSGFLFVVNPMNSGGIAKAKSVLLNTIIGIVIAFAGWMIVDAIMAVLYHPTDASLAGKAWSQLITSGGQPFCLIQEGALQNLNQSASSPSITGVNASGNPTLSFGTGACDSSVLQQSIPSLSSSQANTFACLAKPESSCGARMQNYSWNKDAGKGKASTAYGAFQVLLSSNHSCFENQACYTAAGVTGSLNCQKGFGSNGFTAGGDPTVLANCIKAASDLVCNTTAAVCVQQAQGFTAWTDDPSGAVAQKQCIAQYAGS